HPVFGEVIDGMNVVDKIAAVKTDYSDRPMTEVKIKKASII
ncbi:MAG: peptidylprolyl isomerase, partial [Methanomicrobium sp.]|nr:peptidylprolyl isomerase [Methanomicrobium sp.]